MMSTTDAELTGPAAAIADAILRSTNPAGDGPPADRDALITAVRELLAAGMIAVPLELGDVEQYGPARLTARTAAILAAANLLEARKAAGNASCEDPTEHVRDLCLISAGWRELALALASHSAMNDDNEGTDR